MRIPTPLYALGAAAAMTILAGCSGGTSSVAPVGGSSNLSHARVAVDVAHVPSLNAPSFQNMLPPSQPGSMHSFMSPDASGITPTLYVSQFYTNDIQVYRQGGTNQSPIGTITNGVVNPQGMFVTPNNWVYVANTGANNV